MNKWKREIFPPLRDETKPNKFDRRTEYQSSKYLCNGPLTDLNNSLEDIYKYLSCYVFTSPLCCKRLNESV